MLGRDKDKKIHTDPVCGMQVNEKDAVASERHEGQKYYFCSKECEQQFKAAPDRYSTSVVPK